MSSDFDITRLNIIQLTGIFLTERDFDYLITEARKVKNEEARNEIAKMLKDMLDFAGKVDIALDKSLLKTAMSLVSMLGIVNTELNRASTSMLAFLWILWKLKIMNIPGFEEELRKRGWY